MICLLGCFVYFASEVEVGTFPSVVTVPKLRRNKYAVRRETHASTKVFLNILTVVHFISFYILTLSTSMSQLVYLPSPERSVTLPSFTVLCGRRRRQRNKYGRARSNRPHSLTSQPPNHKPTNLAR